MRDQRGMREAPGMSRVDGKIAMRYARAALLAIWLGCVPLAAGDGAVNAPVPPYAVWEATVPVVGLAPATDPAVVAVEAVITAPSGRAQRVAGFLYQGFERSRDAQGREQLQAKGPPDWEVRHAAAETGVHAVRFLVRRAGGAEQVVGSASMEVAPPTRAADGFLRGGAKCPERFAFDSGRGYFALGHNLGWVKRERGTYRFDEYLAKMAAAGENYTRLWLCTWGLDLDTTTPYGVDLEDAWRLDHVLREAARLGIYVKLCLDNFYDFQHHFDQSPYNQKNGGPCRVQGEFFVRAEARQQYLAKLRYLAARYGAFTSLMAWALWNEMDYALHPEDLGDAGPTSTYATYDTLRDKIMIPWTLDVARALRQFDPYRHLITTSLGLHSIWDDLWPRPEMDFVQYHSYVHYLEWLRDPDEKDVAAFVLRGQAEVARYRKPAFLAEFGYMGQGEASSMNPRDPQGVALHNAIWAGAMSGAAGTPMLWWWDNYIDPMDLYYHYRGLSTFLREVDWTQAFTPMRVEASALRVLALRGTSEVLVWVQNLENTWHARVEQKREPRALENVVLALRNFPAGSYRISWHDPYRGVALSTYTLDGRDGVLRLRPPAFRTDVAARLILEERPR